MTDSVPYEQHLASDMDWAMKEASAFFNLGGGVQATVRRLAEQLDELGISYALIGGMALFRYGYRRFTEDVDSRPEPG